MSTQATIYGVISALENYPVDDAKKILFRMAQELERTGSIFPAPAIEAAPSSAKREEYSGERDGVSAGTPKEAPGMETVESIMEVFDEAVEASIEHGEEDEAQDWLDIKDVRVDFHDRITKLLSK